MRSDCVIALISFASAALLTAALGGGMGYSPLAVVRREGLAPISDVLGRGGVRWAGGGASPAALHALRTDTGR